MSELAWSNVVGDVSDDVTCCDVVGGVVIGVGELTVVDDAVNVGLLAAEIEVANVCIVEVPDVGSTFFVMSLVTVWADCGEVRTLTVVVGRGCEVAAKLVNVKLSKTTSTEALLRGPSFGLNSHKFIRAFSSKGCGTMKVDAEPLTKDQVKFSC